MPVDPQVQTVLDEMAALGFPGFAGLEAGRARAVIGAMERAPGEPVASVEDRALPGPAGPIPVRLYRPSADASLPLVVYFHGGGWTIGDLETHDGLCRAIANRSGSA